MKHTCIGRLSPKKRDTRQKTIQPVNDSMTNQKTCFITYDNNLNPNIKNPKFKTYARNGVCTGAAFFTNLVTSSSIQLFRILSSQFYRSFEFACLTFGSLPNLPWSLQLRLCSPLPHLKGSWLVRGHLLACERTAHSLRSRSHSDMTVPAIFPQP